MGVSHAGRRGALGPGLLTSVWVDRGQDDYSGLIDELQEGKQRMLLRCYSKRLPPSLYFVLAPCVYVFLCFYGCFLLFKN